MATSNLSQEWLDFTWKKFEADIICLAMPQMYDLCDLLGTQDAPASKIASVL